MLIHNLTLSNFRGFREFSMHNLGRVNLLVGKNNCGKTTVLEALNLLAAVGDQSVLWHMGSRRGERIVESSREGYRSSIKLDISHLFYGHVLDSDSQFAIAASNDGGKFGVSAEMISPMQGTLFEDEDSTSNEDQDLDATGWQFVLRWFWGYGGEEDVVRELDLGSEGGVSYESLRRVPRLRESFRQARRYVATAGLSVEEIVSMFDEVVLTQEEERVVEALQTIDPSIDRVATVGFEAARSSISERAGIVVRRRDSSERIPIGSMGDGIWRMLGLVLSLTSAQNGIVLIDEIDTGLHYTVMEKMWRLLYETAERLNVQVFATTHSRDAYESLSSIAAVGSGQPGEVSIHRIEAGLPESIAFSEPEIVAAANRGLEIR